MMLKSKLAAFAVTLILAGSGFSAQQATCPDLNDIQAEGLSMAEQLGYHNYFSYNISTYNTEITWGFVIGPFESDSDDIAIETANEILSTMSAPGVPEQREGAMLCTYDTGHKDVFAAAIQSDEGHISPLKLKQYLKTTH